MTDSSASSDSSPARAWRIDKVCDQFEAAWLAGQTPRINDYLRLVSEDERSALQDELAALDVEYRQRGVAFQGRAGPPVLSPPPTITLTVIAGPNQGNRFSFDRHDTFIVGRGSTAHLRLPPKDKFFSRHHFLLEINPPLCRLTDLSSRNGTFVNGRRVMVTDLHDGDIIVGGDTSLRLGIEQQRSPTIDSTANPSGSAANTKELLLARQLGPYELLRELGRGGMGTVYLARHVTSGELRAVKTLRGGGAASEAEVQRFLREARILEQLRHAHIVAHLDSGQAAHRVYFAMEYVAGTDAVRVLKQEGKLTVGRAARWMCQLLDALDHAHAQGIVHRDIKPANLLIEPGPHGERLKLADFGLARIYQASTLSGLTLDGETGGSLPFMAPEQLTDYRNVDPRCDLYSTAATLYALLTDTYVYDFPSKMADRIITVLQQTPRHISTRCDHLPQALCDLIHRALDRIPENRFASANEMRLALLTFAEPGC